MELLLDFATAEERLDRIDAFIDSVLAANPKATTFDINEKLRRSHAYIKEVFSIMGMRAGISIHCWLRQFSGMTESAESRVSGRSSKLNLTAYAKYIRWSAETSFPSCPRENRVQPGL